MNTIQGHRLCVCCQRPGADTRCGRGYIHTDCYEDNHAPGSDMRGHRCVVV